MDIHSSNGKPVPGGSTDNINVSASAPWVRFSQSFKMNRGKSINPSESIANGTSKTGNSTKLDLARTYIDMGDEEGAIEF